MHLIDKEKFKESLNWSDYMRMDWNSLKHCDAILKISSSHGADLEEKLFLNNHKKVYYDIQNIPREKIKTISEQDIEEIFSRGYI